MTYKPHYKYVPPVSWSILTPFYDFSCALFGLGEKFKRKVLESVTLEDGMTVADIGCGTGVFLKVAKQNYPHVKFIGIDPDRDALSIAARRFRRAGLNIEIKKAFAESLPLDDASVDVCYSTLAFHHMPDDIKYKAIQEMRRIVKPHGMAVIADFGESKSVLFRKILFFEDPEYLEGNLRGLIPKYFKEAGFHEPKTVGRHFPGIAIIKAQRSRHRQDSA